MKFAFAAAFALLAALPLHAQILADQSHATPIPGSWAYLPIADGSQAVFSTPAAQPQLTLTCSRTTRRITLSKPANAAGALSLWTSSRTFTTPAGYDAARARLNAQFGAWDPLLDALAYSRGRFAVSAAGTAPLVLPVWADLSRVIEDCRT